MQFLPWFLPDFSVWTSWCYWGKSETVCRLQLTDSTANLVVYYGHRLRLFSFRLWLSSRRISNTFDVFFFADFKTHMFPFMGTRTASPRGRYGERPQRDSVWRYICKNTTCWPATAHDVTTGVPQYKCRRENTSSAFSSSLTGLFEACNLVRVQFSLYQMASTSKAFKIVCG